VPAPAAVAAPRDVAVSYTAPSGCPGIDGYLSDVRSRATRLNVEPEPLPGAGETVDVIVEPEPGASTWRGRVSITGERALEREVRSERCEDVVAALALITVLRLEGADTSSAVAAGVSAAGGTGAPGAAAPSASGAAGGSAGGVPGAPEVPGAVAEPSASEPSGSASPDGETAPDESAGPDAPAQPEPGENAAEAAGPDEAGPDEAGPGASGAIAAEPELPEPLEPEPSIVVPRPEAEEEPADEDDDASDDTSDGAAEPEPPSEPWPALEVGLAAYGGYASVPAHAVKATLEGELRFGEGVSSWAVLLSLAYAHGDSPVPSGELGLTLLTAQLGLCPPAFVNEPSVWIRGCASLRGGGLRSTVSSSDPTFLAEFDQHWGPWLAVGPSLSAGVPLSESLALRGLVELAVQLVRDRYNAVQPNEETGVLEPFVLYEPEALSIELGLGLGYTF
jgi:hypothetical protein